MPNIEIPEQVIQARIDWAESTDEQWSVYVMVADAEVLTVNVQRQWDRTGSDWASSAEEAEKVALTEFGKRLKKLIGD